MEGMKENLIDVVTPWIDVFFALVTTPFEFDWVATFLTFFQSVAIAVIFVIVMVRGITSGVFGEAFGQQVRPELYLARSFVPIFLVAATPAIVGVVTTVTTGIAQAVASTGNEGFATALVNQLLGQNAAGEVTLMSINPAIAAVSLVIALYYVTCICAQCLSRWVQLTAYSIITPLTCIFTALEDSSDYVTILKSMSFAGIITVIQLLLLQSAAYMPVAGARIVSAASLPLGMPEATMATMGSVMLTVAVLGATKQVPNWIEKFTASAGVAGRGSFGRVTTSAVRTVTSIARVVGR